MLLDCPSKIFSWINPASFVVVAPDTDKESSDSSAFTQAMLKVLEDENLTVEAFAGHVQAVYERVSQICSHWLYRRDGVEVRAFGVNVNRLLFNVKGQKSHHAFIPCRALYWRCSSLKVCVGAVYGIYRGNIKGSNFLGNLETASTTAEWQYSMLLVSTSIFRTSSSPWLLRPNQDFVIGRAD